MKKLHYICLTVLAVFAFACTDNPLEDVEGTDWQKERNIVSILVEGQIGTAIIERDADNAQIKIFAKVENIVDISKVEIKNIQLAYGASTTNEVGTTLDLTSGSAIITVNSGAGKSLDWKVSVSPFKSDLEGSWFVGDIRMYCDMFTWESWGWEKNESIFGYLPELGPEWDNEIIFTVEGADEKGNPFGNYEHSAGNDGLYGNFGDASRGWDFNDRFRKLPIGKGTWLRDFERNKVVITDENRVEHELDLDVLIETNEVKLESELPYLSDLFSWSNTDWSYEELSHMSNPMWYVLTKERILQTGNSITGLTVKDQVGDAQFDNDAKQVIVTIEDNGADRSMVLIESLRLSFGASSSVSEGDTLDFSLNNETTVTVTSETGESAVWTIKLQIDIDLSDVSIAGTWSIGEIGIYSDLFSWESWGWDKTESLNNYLPNADTELDNTITFIVDGINTAGQAYGTFDHNAGADGAYGNFVSDDASWPETDFNARFRKVPTGAGTWIINEEKVVITDAAGAEYILDIEVKTETEIALSSALEYKSELFDWGVSNYSYEETAHMSNKMWYNLTK
ncbi:hypothetical protein [Algibacter sp. Ld11]|uniref:hypothetical protein n=1 Tax=Algibacter sp. Ld11 TaxID=649150 RepID=UPI00386FAB6F